MKIRSLLPGLTGLLFAAAATAYAAVPMPYRALTPTWFGTEHIGNNIYTDTPNDGGDLHRLHTQARALVVEKLGPFRAQPSRIIICKTKPCQERFGFGTIGLALGKHAILLGPEGANKMILAHELVHIHIKADITWRDYVWPRIPTWFDEGLATFLTEDPRLTVYAPAQAAWILQAQGPRDWSRMTRADTWPDTYGAAQSLVRDIHARIGWHGIRHILAQARDPASFDAALRAQLGAEWP